MTLSPLRADALGSHGGHTVVRVSLPWIRSLPLASFVEPTVHLDGAGVEILGVLLGDRLVSASGLAREDGWWFAQDRVGLALASPASDDSREVTVEFGLRIPYLQAGPEGPLTLRFRDSRRLRAGTAGPPRSTLVTSERPAEQPADRDEQALPDGWVLSASSFNWTPDMIATCTGAADLVVGIVEAGLAREVEAEPGQLWRTFPGIMTADAEALRDRLASAGGVVSIVGASIDDWSPRGHRRTDDERLAFLLPQLDAAQRLGARGVRLPIGQAGPRLLERVRPLLHEKNLIWFEEVQGAQTPASPQAGPAIDRIVSMDDPRIRLLVDISMVMPAVPESYLDRLGAGGIPEAFLTRVRDRWRDPEITNEIMGFLRSGAVPAGVHTLYMDMMVRFGRSDASVIGEILPWVGAFHLKFWDLDDTGGRVSDPIRDLGELLVRSDFRGTLCSEWGGQAWLDDDPTRVTRDHLGLARTALRDGIRRAS